MCVFFARHVLLVRLLFTGSRHSFAYLFSLFEHFRIQVASNRPSQTTTLTLPNTFCILSWSSSLALSLFFRHEFTFLPWFAQHDRLFTGFHRSVRLQQRNHSASILPLFWCTCLVRSFNYLPFYLISSGMSLLLLPPLGSGNARLLTHRKAEQIRFDETAHQFTHQFPLLWSFWNKWFRHISTFGFKPNLNRSIHVRSTLSFSSTNSCFVRIWQSSFSSPCSSHALFSATSKVVFFATLANLLSRFAHMRTCVCVCVGFTVNFTFHD